MSRLGFAIGADRRSSDKLKSQRSKMKSFGIPMLTDKDLIPICIANMTELESELC